MFVVGFVSTNSNSNPNPRTDPNPSPKTPMKKKNLVIIKWEAILCRPCQPDQQNQNQKIAPGQTPSAQPNPRRIISIRNVVAIHLTISKSVPQARIVKKRNPKSNA
jgi:hypothetical protein